MRPTALVFCQSFPGDSDHLRAELRGLGAELLVLTPQAGLRIGPDDPPDELPPSPAAWRERGVPPCAPLAFFFLDERGEVMLHRRSGSLVELLREARTARAFALTRRQVLTSGMAAAALAACAGGPRPQPAGAEKLVDAPAGSPIPIELNVNGKDHTLSLEPRVTLLDALREGLGLTGAKKGCDMGQCGACTVLADGERILSCLTLAATAQRRQIVTIEGLARGEELHPMQQAFLDHDAFQCGYCTPGQILSAVALLKEGKANSREEIRELMSGNLCRCGAYPNIVDAIVAAKEKV